jgi:hypothetical protein
MNTMNWAALIQYAVCLIVPLLIVTLSDRYFPILRDIPADARTPATHRPYSLGRVQMAFWTIIVIGSLVYIYWVAGGGKGDFPPVDANLVLLLGISGGTGVMAAAVDVSKDRAVDETRSNFAGTSDAIRALDAQILALAGARDANGDRALDSPALNSLVSERATKMRDLAGQEKALQRSERDDEKRTFLMDLLSDQNGNSLHRLQLVLFTVLFGAYVVHHVFTATTLGDTLLTNEQLALMGVASGVYVGFKVPGKTAS